MMDDYKIIFCIWFYGYGGKVFFIVESKDVGLIWKNGKIFVDWQMMSNCFSIYKLMDKQGKECVFVFSVWLDMFMIYSEDGGKSWSLVCSLNKFCVMVFLSIVKLKNGDYFGLYYCGLNDWDCFLLILW